ILKAQASEYVLGASLPLTGPFATAGQLVAPAFNLAAKLFNDEGGIAGTPIRFVTEDSGYIPQNTLANYQRALATEGTNMIGYFADSTGAMKLIAPELKGENARIMGSTSFASELADPATHPYQYMSGPTYQSQIDILLNNIKNEGGSTVAFIFSNTEFGRDPIEHGKKTAEALGLKVVLEESTKPQGADIPTNTKSESFWVRLVSSYSRKLVSFTFLLDGKLD
ncbi:MAG: ABC transporter substrate-binding protein, partial [Pseudomonadota bacterium]